MLNSYSDPTIAPQEIFSNGSSKTDYTSTSNHLVLEAIQEQIKHFFPVAEDANFQLTDRTPGTRDKLSLKLLATLEATSDGNVKSKEDVMDLSWLFLAYDSREQEQPSVTVLANCIQGIGQLIERGKFDLLGKILVSANPAKMSNETMLAFARTTFSVRERLSNWKIFVREVGQELDRRGKDGSRLLKGLL